jgi:hypothetical protein
MTRRENLHSIRGETPTEYEHQLFAAIDDPYPVSPWAMIGKRLGIAALAVVLDEVGGGKVYVPTRKTFFQELAAARRDARIGELLAKGMPMRDVARHVGLSPGRICAIAKAFRATPQR